ncbi:hypothetical protein, partial [Klebsiella variicola]|uniref:hypothetical protein n=1 Tax=Klebsiella variicola TaxID=244366 RepID=UPI002730FA99
IRCTELLYQRKQTLRKGTTAQTQLYTNQGFNINTTSIEIPISIQKTIPVCHVVEAMGRIYDPFGSAALRLK